MYCPLVARLHLPHPAQKIHPSRSHRNYMLPIRMKSTGIEIITHIQCTKTCSGTGVPHLERQVIRGRHNDVSCWIDRTSIHPTRMPAQRTLFHACTRIPYFECVVIGGRNDGVP